MNLVCGKIFDVLYTYENYVELRGKKRNMSTTVWILIAFACYLIGMVLIGASFMNKTKNSEDYFLGGRGLNGWVAALSAQASDMSGWLLMGLPGSVYALGTGQAWIAVGLLLGTIANWIFISGRLRRYTIRANNALTFPAYLEHRFHDKKRVLLVASSCVIVIFFLVYTASALSAGGKLFSSVFNIEYRAALTIGAIVILIYTFMGGFMAVCTTDFIQGLLMLIGVLTIPIIAFYLIGSENVIGLLNESGVTGGASSFLNIMHDNGKPVSVVSIISQLGWGLGYCGMPHILVRFMAVSSEKELKKSKTIAIVWVAISLTFACIIGVIGRAYLYPMVLDSVTKENVFMEMIQKLFVEDIKLPFVGGVFLCGILAAIMSTADSQLLVTASSVAEDLYKGVLKKDAKDRNVLWVSRIAVVVIAVIAYIIALNPNSSVMGLVSNAWAGLGAAFGPTILLSLYWRRINLPGAIAGTLSGAGTVLVWDYLPIINGQTLGATTGLYSLVVGFGISIVAIVMISLCTKAPSQEMLEEFQDVANHNVKEAK